MANELIIEKDSDGTTKARYKEAFQVETRLYKIKLFLTFVIKSEKLYNFSIDVLLRDANNHFQYLKTDLQKVEDLNRIDLQIRGEDLANKKLIISGEFQKIDPNGLVLKDNELQDEINIELSYDLEAGFEQVIDLFKVAGLFPKKVTESIYTEIDFI